MAYTRHNEVPVFEQRPGTVLAAYYNQVMLARRRIEPELRLPLPGLKALHLILQDDAWVIVDSSLDDIPIAAWSDFQTSQRSNLHEPLACRLRLYHMSAGLLLERALESMHEQLRDRLSPDAEG